MILGFGSPSTKHFSVKLFPSITVFPVISVMLAGTESNQRSVEES